MRKAFKVFIMPIVGSGSGGIDGTDYVTPLSRDVTAPGFAEAKKQGAVLAGGNVLQATVNVVIIAAVPFLVVTGMTAMKARVSPADVAANPVRPIRRGRRRRCCWKTSATCRPARARRAEAGSGRAGQRQRSVPSGNRVATCPVRRRQ